MTEFEPPPAPDPFPGGDEFPEGPPPTEPVKPPEAKPGMALQTLDDLPAEAINPVTHEIIQVHDPAALAQALDEARMFKREQLDPYINGLERVSEVMSRTIGSRTIRAGEYELVVTVKRDYQRDLASMKKELLAVGLPKERADDVIKETVVMSATQQDLDRLSKSNEDYKAIIDRHTTVTERPSSTKVNRAKSAD